MEKITTVGIDLAKQVMALYGMDAESRTVMRKVLRRNQLLRWTAAQPPSDGDGGVWWGALPGAGIDATRARGTHHCSGVRAGVSQERKERRQRCVGNL